MNRLSTRTLRRTIQTASLLVFLVLTFYVCCPYAGLVMENAAMIPPVSVADSGNDDNDAFGAELAGDISSASSPKMPDHYAESFRRKTEYVAPYLFLAVDPSVALVVIASQDWAAFRGEILVYAGVVIVLSWIFTRCFCGYACPMGTCVDASDWLLARIPLVNRCRRRCARGLNAVHRLRFGVLIALLIAALCGVVLTGYVSPIPILTRNIGFVFAPFQTAYYRGWHQVPPHDVTVWISVLTFGAILAAGLFTPRFFCRFVCPSGALFSLVNSAGTLFAQRIDAVKCVKCGNCVDACRADAIRSDMFTIVPARCTSCQACADVCPTTAISYGVAREKDAPLAKRVGERRLVLQYGLMCSGLGAAVAFAMSRLRGDDARAATLIRPPGSLDEERFLKLCVRCGVCFRVCPNDALQPCDLAHGLESLWTPRLAADWSGCEPSCNNCGVVCPSGAIQPLALDAKRRAVIGVACVERGTCLPYAGKEECKLCHDECHRAGYDAIEFMQVGTEVDSDGQPIDGSGFTAPVVLCDKCIGCGLCQARCYAINVKTKKLLTESAVIVKQSKKQSGIPVF